MAPLRRALVAGHEIERRRPCRGWPACRRWSRWPRSCPTSSTSAPSRRNLSTTLSSAATAEMSQKWAWRDVDHAPAPAPPGSRRRRRTRRPRRRRPARGPCRCASRPSADERRVDPEDLADLPGEEDAAQQHADQHADAPGCAWRRRPTTVASITMLELRGWVRRFRIEAQLKVPIETMIMTATSAAIGIRPTQSPSTTIRNSRNDARRRRSRAARARRTSR